MIEPPVGSINSLLENPSIPADLLDAAQGAPNYPPALTIIEKIREVVAKPEGGRYVDGRGLPSLRSALAEDLSADYRGEVRAENVVITAGSNQAFCVTLSALAQVGDEVILVVPFYFNHDMWIRLDQLRPIYVDAAEDSGHISLDEIARAVTSRTRMIVLTSPGNPTGVTTPSALVDGLADLCQAKGLALVLDETYRVFRSDVAPSHDLFQRTDWPEYLVSLQSFSKDFALPGYRVGAVVGAPDLLDQVMKLLDCIAICAPRVGQEAALEGLKSAKDWRRERVREVATKHERFRAVMERAPGGFRLSMSGGFYAWIRHPWQPGRTDEVVERLALECGVLTISGNAFTPSDRGFIRVSFANLGLEQFDELARRLDEF